MSKDSDKVVPLYPKGSFLQVTPAFGNLFDTGRFYMQVEHVRKVLLTVIPKNIRDLSSANTWLLKQVPYVFWSKCLKVPDLIYVSLFSLPEQKVSSEPFFLNLIKQYLLENSDIEISSLLNFSFKILEDKNHPFKYSEVALLIKNKRDLEFVKKSLPQLKRQLLLGLNSFRYASFLSQEKPELFSKKISAIFKDLNGIIENRTNLFDESIFHLIYRFISLAGNHFCIQRSCRHFSRIACYFYFLKRDILSCDKQILVQLFPAKICYPFGKKSILSLLFASKVSSKLTLKEYQITKSIKKFVANAQLIVGSFFYFLQEEETQIRFFYLEIEKSDGLLFSRKEIALLKANLEEELYGREQDMIPPSLKTLSESEKQCYSCLLSKKIQFLSDPCYSFIYFSEEQEKRWIFKTLIVRLQKPHSPPISSLFLATDLLTFKEDKQQVIEHLHGKYPKIASFFSVYSLKESPFFESNRADSIYKARDAIFSYILKKLGKVEDFNGGIILKQAKKLEKFKSALIDIPCVQYSYLQKFFYSISPIESQLTLPLKQLKVLFLLFFQKEELIFKEESNFLYCRLTLKNKDASDIFFQKLDSSPLNPLAFNFFSYEKKQQIGIIFNFYNKNTRNLLKKLIKEVIQE